VQPHSDLAQHVIADPMTEGIVDEFEAIQIHDQDRQRLSLRLRQDDAPFQRFGELRAIRQLRERVLVGEFQYALLAFGNAGTHMIQALCQRADLIVALHLYRRGVVALANALDR
jgi:hypothetical protein